MNVKLEGRNRSYAAGSYFTYGLRLQVDILPIKTDGYHLF